MASPVIMRAQKADDHQAEGKDRRGKIRQDADGRYENEVTNCYPENDQR